MTIAPVRLASKGACVMFPCKPGDVILVNLVGRTATFRAYVLEGTAVACDLVFPGNPVRIELRDFTAREFLDLVSDHGFGHHWIIGYGNEIAS